MSEKHGSRLRPDLLECRAERGLYERLDFGVLEKRLADSSSRL